MPVAVTIAIALYAGTNLSAHRLDEYLQAARIDLRRDGVAIDLALTPGAAIAESIIAMIDRDRDGLLSDSEEHTYAAAVVRSLQISVDGQPLTLDLASSSFPTRESFRQGTGTIRLQAGVTRPALRSGRHQLLFRNDHGAGQSVYLANALVPVSADVVVDRQRRDVSQRELAIDYSVGSAMTGYPISFLMVGLVATVVMVRYSRRYGV